MVLNGIWEGCNSQVIAVNAAVVFVVVSILVGVVVAGIIAVSVSAVVPTFHGVGVDLVW